MGGFCLPLKHPGEAIARGRISEIVRSDMTTSTVDIVAAEKQIQMTSKGTDKLRHTENSDQE